MGMNSSRFKPEIYFRLIHPLMSVSVSVTGVLAVIWLVGANFGIAAPRTGTILAVLFAPILEAVVGNILYRERAGIANRVRELILYLIVLYLLLSIARPGPFVERFMPTLAQVMPVIAATVAWLIAYVFHDRLRGRESLLQAYHGKNGAVLRRAVLERQHDMALTVGHLRKARGLMAGLFALQVVLLLLAHLDFLETSAIREGGGAFVMLIFYGVSAIATIGNLNTFIQEYAANGEGLPVPLRFHRRRSLAAAALIVLVIILSFALSRNESILPIEAIGDFFRWFASLFERDVEFAPEPPPPQQTPQQPIPPEMLELLEQGEDQRPPLWLRILARLLERLALGALIVGGAVLLFGPLFSPAFRKALKEFRPRPFLQELLRNLRRRMRIIGRLIRSGFWRRRRRPEDETEEQTEANEAWRESQWKPGLRKRRQMDRVVQVFVDVTRWGEKRGLRYTRNQAATEYLRAVAVLRPERYADAHAVADTFCEARFSRHLLTRVQMREYVVAAKRITATE
jgi:hypothetical protein